MDTRSAPGGQRLETSDEPPSGLLDVHPNEAHLDGLQGQTVAVVGYGSQGRAQARTLAESGVDVVVGVREGGGSWTRAREEGLEVAPIPEAARVGDIVMVLVPDDVHPEVLAKVKPGLEGGDALVFAHGFTVWSGRVGLPDDVDVLLLAPKSPGAKLWEAARTGSGVPCLVAVHQDASGRARQRLFALAEGLRATRAGLVETTFAEETVTDLFGEQAVLCGGLVHLIRAGFETLVDAGYQPEVAYFETVHEMKLIVDLVVEGGIEHMWANVSDTAEYGGRTRGPRVLDDGVQRRMRRLLDEVRDGTFTSEWSKDVGSEPSLLEEASKRPDPPIDQVGDRVRRQLLGDGRRD